MKNLIYLFIISIIILSTVAISKFSEYESSKKGKLFYEKINKENQRETVNELAMPFVENDKKYIEEQTKRWIVERKEKGYCYGLLEKDKIVMVKWMKKFNILAPEIYYYNYHDKFVYSDLKRVVKENPDKNLIIKISHLQSNYGIIIVPPFNSQKDETYLFKIYEKCLEKFKTCFVCNHDNGTAPSLEEINSRKKESYYELYETIEPGIIIQNFFYTKENVYSQPSEMKILVLGDKILSGVKEHEYERYKPVYEKAKEISKLLGSTLIRVDFFVKEKDNPYVPYLNEISLSPFGGFRTKNIEKDTLEIYKNSIKNLKKVDMEINDLVKNSPMRTIPIEKYLTDKDWGIWWNEKFRFGLVK